MKQIKSLSAPLKRITVLDALRGFALLGVILMHMIQHFGIFSFPRGEGEPRFPEMDEAIQWIGQNIITGRFINIFGFLFGMSFFIQMERAAKRGIDFRKGFVWRMFILLIIGLISHSFFNLEIISIYAVFGLVLVPLYRVKNWVLLVIIALLLLGTPRIIQTTIHNNTLTEQTDEAQNENNEQSSRDMPEYIQNPSFLNSVKHNYSQRLPGKLNYQFGMYGRGYITLALFVLGLIVGRLRFFEKVHINKRRNLFLFIGFVLATLLIGWVKDLLPSQDLRMLMRPGDEPISASLLMVKALEDINLVLFSGALAMGFITLYQVGRLNKYLDVLSPYGRMALTNYIMQGVIGALLFSLWALGPIFASWGGVQSSSYSVLSFIYYKS